ncbi:MAG: putative phage abortive infection protein [Ignavibacteria bacterium]|nr:putative phage abortive infection protein [Ignavibacteria bacterium]
MLEESKNIVTKTRRFFTKKKPSYSLLFLIVLGIWIFSWITLIVFIPDNFQKRSEFGDMFGAVNALFSGLALAGLIITIRLQSKQIKKQKKDIEQVRKDSEKQNFENVLFNLLEAQRQIIEQVSCINYNSKKIEKREVFKEIEEDIEFLYKAFSNPNDIGPITEDNENGKRLLFLFTTKYVERYWPKYFGEDDHKTKTGFALELIKERKLKKEKEKLKHVYLATFYCYHRQIGHYFRHLYHILKFIEENENLTLGKTKDLEEREAIKKKFQGYADIVQSELSTSEHFVLFFNGLCFKNMKALLYKYQFLENLAAEHLINKKHKKMYGGEKIDGIDYKAISFKSLDNLVS